VDSAEDEARRAYSLGRERGKEGEDDARRQRQAIFVGVKLGFTAIYFSRVPELPLICERISPRIDVRIDLTLGSLRGNRARARGEAKRGIEEARCERIRGNEEGEGTAWKQEEDILEDIFET
jgi:hypothetical protein